MLNRRPTFKKWLISSVLLLVGLFLPLLFDNAEEVRRAFSPMHFPVLLCGLTCGWRCGMILGGLLPLLRSLLFGLPSIPVALPMIFEMASYGALAGLLYPRLAHLPQISFRLSAMLLTLLISMLAGRLIGILSESLLFCLILIHGKRRSLDALVDSYFFDTSRSVLLHLTCVPPVALLMERLGLSQLSAGELPPR